MKIRFLLLIAMAASFCLFFEAHAQCPNSTKLNISTTLYTQENGLPTNVLTRIAKDSMGFRYFLGVDMQWVRYDGIEFSKSYREKETSFDRTEYSRGAQCSYVFKGPLGLRFKKGKGNELGWAVANDTLFCIDTFLNKKQAFPLPATIRRQLLNCVPDNEICWLATDRDIYRFELSAKTFIRLALPIWGASVPVTVRPMTIYFRSDGVPLVPFYNMVLQLDHYSPTVKKFCNILPGQFNVHSPSMAMADHLFAANANGVFNDLNLITGVVSTFDIKPFRNKQDPVPTTINTWADYEGNLLIGTSNAGMFLFDTCNHSIQRIDYQQKMAPTELANAVLWIAVDDEAVIWVQTEAGLIKMEVNKHNINTYQPSSVELNQVGNICNNIRAIYPTDSMHLAVGSLGGAYIFDLASKKMQRLNLFPLQANGTTAVGCIGGDGRCTIFLGNYGYHGILLYNQTTKKQASVLDVGQQSEYFCNIANCLLYDSQHTLWVGCNNGIRRIQQLDKFIAGGFAGNALLAVGFPALDGQLAYNPNITFYALAEDGQGNIWAGAWDGLYVYNRKKGTVVKYVHNPANPQSISDNVVRSICLSKNNDVWIGTLNGGLNHFNTATGVFTAYTTDNGLPNNTIYTILEDNSGLLWLGTNAGLCRFNKTDHAVRNYTPRDGVQNFEFNTNAASLAPNGLLCFGGTSGFNIFQPDSLSNGFAPPKAVITRFKIFDQEYPVPASVLTLPHGQNAFSFEFASLSYYRSSEHQYAYMLEGVDKDWIKSGNRHFTNYVHLLPGRYVFKVRVANYTGVWSKEITTLTFIINPAWYNTWWFRLAIALLVTSGLYGLYSYRIWQIQKLYNVRNHIASDLHDEIGSTLSSISLMSGMMQRKLQAGDTGVNGLLAQVSSSTSNMLEALSDIVWAINGSNDRFDNVIDRMRAFAIDLLEPAEINIHFDAGNGLSDLKLDMQHRKNLYLIFKEALNNTVKYAACNNVTIDISRKGTKTLLLKITDDGKGFDLENNIKDNNSLSGNGIRNMKKRAEELGAKLDIISAPQKGTSILLEFTI